MLNAGCDSVHNRAKAFEINGVFRESAGPENARRKIERDALAEAEVVGQPAVDIDEASAVDHRFDRDDAACEQAQPGARQPADP